MTKIVLAGATGLVGSELVLMLAQGGHELHLIGRRVVPGLPDGVKQYAESTDKWPAIVCEMGAEIAISCLGTTWAKSGRNEAAFRAVDHDLVLAFAGAAFSAGAKQMISVSSVGASSASNNFYLRTKGETDKALDELDFARVDILRPGLLIGERSGERRFGERIGILVSPITDLFMLGPLAKYRSTPAAKVARAIAQLTTTSGAGRFIHENESIDTLAG